MRAPPASDGHGPLVSIVVPVFRSRSLGRLVDGIEAVFAERPERFEIVLVDDGSPDPEAWTTIEALARAHPEVRGVQLARNFGQNAATLCGLAEARGERVVTMDDDLEHDPADLPALLAHPEADVVIAQLRRRQHGWWRRSLSWLRGPLDRLVVPRPAGLGLSSYRVLSRVVVDGVVAAHPRRPFIPALVFHVSRKALGVPVQHGRQSETASSYSLPRLLSVAADLLLGNSNLPLRVLGGLGALTATAALALLAAWLLGHARVELALGGLIALFGGLQLLASAVVGEQLVRVLWSTEGRPPYVVRRRS